MASFWKKISKTFLTLLLMVGVFFAGFTGLAPTNKANAVFTDTLITDSVIYEDNAIFVEYAGDILVGVDDSGYIYRATDGTANLVKTGVQIGVIQPVSWFGYNNATITPTGKYIAYKNGVVVACSYDCTNTNLYYSTDFGATWKSNNVGAIGTPVTIITGGGYFAVMTQYEVPIHGKIATAIYTSTDGINWQLTKEFLGYENVQDSEMVFSHFADMNFSYNNGYFVKTTAYDYEDLEENIFIQVSIDLKNWTSIEAPNQAYVTTEQAFPCSTVAFVLDNALYCVQDGKLYKTTTFASDATWQLVQEDFGYYYAIKPYQNGIIATYRSDNTYSIIYMEISESGKVNAETLLSNGLFEFSYPDINKPYGADTVAIGQKYLTVGFSGQYYCTGSVDYKTAMFRTYEQNIKHNVSFVDWNGNTITQVQVADGDTVTAPANPTREGYNFVGWDYDFTQPITNNITITAIYEIKTYTIEFLDWNGQLISSVTKDHGSVLVESDIPTPVRDAYSFVGWDKDLGQTITSDITFIAQYTRDLTITINYLEPYGTAGLVNQFTDMRSATKVFNYVYGDKIATDELETWYNTTILPWETDLSADGLYNYTYLLTGWDTVLPSEITNNIVVNATYEKLNTVTLVYYSQLRFLAYEEDDGTDYYYTFIGYMTVDKLMADGEIINLEDFKNPNANYHIYNTSRNTFYNNLEYFEFLGWDRDVTQPITEDVTITAQYNLPKVTMRLFDSDQYFIGEMQQEISFMTIEDLQALEGAGSAWDKVREGFRLFFSLQWGDLGGMIADSIDLSNYLKSVRQFHTADCQLLTAFICVNTDYPEYGGIFKNGLVATSSPCLSYYTGTANENNMSFWINPVLFATTLYPLTCTVSYANALGSLVKTVTQVFDTVWGVVSEYWWAILLVVLAIIFRKPLIAGLSMLFGAIKKGTQKLSAKVKSKSKNSEYKKTEREYTAVKKQSKKKEK